jgi:hypothetical protein
MANASTSARDWADPIGDGHAGIRLVRSRGLPQGHGSTALSWRVGVGWNGACVAYQSWLARHLALAPAGATVAEALSSVISLPNGVTRSSSTTCRPYWY